MKNKTELANLAASLSDDITTVRCTMTPPTVNRSKPRTNLAIYYCTKSTANLLTTGDPVVCTSGDSDSDRFVVRYVHNVDEMADLPDDSVSYGWIVQAVDTEKASRMDAHVEQLTQRLLVAQRRSARERALAALSLTDTERSIFGITDQSAATDPFRDK